MSKLNETISKLDAWIDDPNAMNTEIDACLVADALELLKEQPKWNFFRFRKPTEEEKETCGNIDEWIENCPECGEEVLVWNGKGIHQDTYLDDDGIAYFENSIYDIAEGWAWMPLPKPPKDGDGE